MDGPAGGDDRGAHHGGGPGPRGLTHPGDVGADGVAVPGQAVDEGGAASGGGAHRGLDRGGHRRRGRRVRQRDRLPARSSSRGRRRRRGHDAGRRRPSSRLRSAGSAGRASSRSRSRSSSRATRASTTPSRIDGNVVHDFVSHYYPNVLEAMRTRWISPQFVSTNRVDSVAEYQRGARAGRAGHRGARHRHLGHAHGVVLRAEGPAVLRDRLPPARRGRLGPLLRGQRRRHLPRVGERRSCTDVAARAVAAVRQPGSSRCVRSGTARSPATAGSTRSRPPTASGSSTRTCRPGHAHPAGRGRVHGQRLRADAPPRLRRAARHARRRRAHGARARR